MTTLKIDQSEAQIEALQRRLDEQDAEIAKLKAELGKARAGRAIASASAAVRPAPGAIPDIASAGPAEPVKPPATASNKRNPWSKDYWNLTHQARIWVEDQARAEKLAAAAGVPVVPTLPGRG